jgi:hypothetical protein
VALGTERSLMAYVMWMGSERGSAESEIIVIISQLSIAMVLHSSAFMGDERRKKL